MSTDWTKQAQAEVDRWVEAQRTWWSQVAGGPHAEDTAAGVREAIDAWRQATYRLVDAQAEALLGVLGQPVRPDAGEALDAWTDAQRKMLQDWLAVAGGEPATASGADAPGRRLVESLHEAAEHLVRAQADWAKAWTAAADRTERADSP